ALGGYVLQRPRSGTDPALAAGPGGDKGLDASGLAAAAATLIGGADRCNGSGGGEKTASKAPSELAGTGTGTGSSDYGYAVGSGWDSEDSSSSGTRSLSISGRRSTTDK
ncbi:unnamed protein product, partial [Phaeothamnion confervicola]